MISSRGWERIALGVLATLVTTMAACTDSTSPNRKQLKQTGDAAYAASSTPAGLVAAYGFDEATGSTVGDISANNNVGTLGSGVTRASTGRFGGALRFDGTGRVTVPNSPSLGISGAVTLEAWVNPTSVTSRWRDVIYKGNDNYYLMATSDYSPRPVAAITRSGAWSSTKAFGASTLASNVWTYLAMTYDGATMRLFVNGTQVASTALSGAITTSTNPLTIGGDAIYGQYFQGMIDEVRIYSRALSASEIQADMTTPVGGDPPPPPPPPPSDATAPTVSITSPTTTGAYTTTTAAVNLSGSASDNVGVTQVTWVNNRYGSGTTAGTNSWAVNGIALLSGTNVLTVTARDAANNTATATITVTYNPGADAAAPTVSIMSPTTTGAYTTTTAAVNLSGSASDNVGVTQVTWANNRYGSGTTAGTNNWAVNGIALLSGTNVLTVTARDAANNTATSTITVTYNPSAADATAPTVSISSPSATGAYTTTTGAVNVSGTAGDNVGVTQVTWTNSRGGSGTASGTTSWSVNGVALQSGANVITMTARDAASNASNATITVTYNPPATASAVSMMTQPSSSVQSGSAFAQQPTVQLRDASNNAVGQSGVVVTASIASGTGSLGGNATATTNASGVASFTNLSITGSGSHTLRFAATGLTAATSSSISVTAPPPPPPPPPTGSAPEPGAGDVILHQDAFERAAGSIASGYATRGSVTATSGHASSSAVRFNYGSSSDNLIEKPFAATQDLYIRYWYRASPGADPTCGGRNGSGFKWLMLSRADGVRYTNGVGILGSNNAGMEFSTHDNGSTRMPNPFLQNKSKTPRFGTTNDGQWHKYTIRTVTGTGGYEQIWIDGTLVLDSNGFGYDHNSGGIVLIQFPGTIINAAGCSGFTIDIDDLAIWRK